MSSSYKAKKIRRAKAERRRKIKLSLKLSNPKYRVAFHEVAHAVIIKSFYPHNKVCLSIEGSEDKWIGSTAEPDHRGQTRDWHSHALISIAGVIAETYYTQSHIDNAYRILQKETELAHDYKSFGIAYVNYKKTRINLSDERELSQTELFRKSYFEVLGILRRYGIVKMHQVAKKLVRDLRIEDEQLWIH